MINKNKTRKINEKKSNKQEKNNTINECTSKPENKQKREEE